MLAALRMPAEDGRPINSEKSQINFRLTGFAKDLLTRIAINRGISRTDVVEMLIREEAERTELVQRNRGRLEPT